MRLLTLGTFALVLPLHVFGQNTIGTFAGNQALGAGFSGDGGAPTAAQLSAPNGVAVDSSGNVYIADGGNYVVRKVAGGLIATYTGSAGTPGLIGPNGIAVDSAGNIYIANGPGNRVVRISSGGLTTLAGGTGGFGGDGGPAVAASLNFPEGIAVDAQGNVYIADTANHRIREVSNGIISTVAGTTGLGYNGDNIQATQATLLYPQAVAVDSQGNLYIADTQNQRIRKVSGGIITTVAGNGTAGYSGDKGSAVAAQINGPKGLAVDSTGNLYIADTGNSAIRRVSGSVISTVAGTGTAGYAGDGGPATSALLNLPVGVTVDASGDLYIADTGNNVVREISFPIASNVIPHFAAGSTYVTDFYVVNKGASAASFTIQFFNDAGSPVAVPISGASSAVLSDTVPALGVKFYEAGSLQGATLVSGSGAITATSAIVVQTVFRHLGANGSYYEAGVASTGGSLEFLIPFDATTEPASGSQIYTGLALANMDAVNAANVTCTALNGTGAAIPGAVVVPALNPQGHWAAFNFPLLVGNRGTLDCVSSTRIGVTALRFLGNDALSSLPVILK